MLCITRKLRQRVFINETTFVEILGIDRGRVMLGISAPPDVVIRREELSALAAAEKRRQATATALRIPKAVTEEGQP